MKKTCSKRSIFVRSGLILIVCAGIAACGEGAPSVTGTPALPALTAAAERVSNVEYTVVNLSSAGYGDENGISPQGKVIFNELRPRDETGGAFRLTGGYYDGTRVYPVVETFGLVHAVNDAGQVVGTRTSNGKLRQFIWTVGGGAVDLLPEGTTNGLAVDINAAGEVAFLVEDPQNLDRQLLYRWKDGVASPASGFPNGTSLGLVRINAEGAIAGDYVVTRQTPLGPDTEGHSYVWKDGSITDLGILGERQPDLYYTSEVKNINDNGQVIGNSSTKTSVSFSKSQAFAWTPQSGKMEALGSLRSDKEGASFAFHSNNLGQVIGNAVTDNGTLHGYSWTDAGGMIDLTPDLSNSEAKAVNNLGQVVGFFGPSPQTASGFLWSAAEGLIDLNTRIPRALRESGFRILTGVAISDTGSILAMSNTGLVLLIPGVPNAAAPSVGQINGNIVLAVGTPLAVSATFVDADVADTHVAQWAWGDGTSSVAVPTESGGTGTVAGNRIYSTSGIYKVTLTVTDNTGRSAEVSQDIVVYDPAGGYVTGGGWIHSPAGAYRANASLSGRATFGFVSKYERGATVPAGNTQFRFVSAKFGFSSTSYDWLVVGGARAQYKGTGTLNGVEGYKFMLTAIDGDKVGQADRFRIKIFHTNPDTGEEVTDYDNQTTTGTEGTLNEGTMVNGSIVVHKS